MSCFNSCENCGIGFPITQYVFAWCEKCLKTIQCKSCDNFMTMEDHRNSLYHDECMSCFGEEQDKERDAINERNKAVKVELSEYSKLSDQDLESAWQKSANMIGSFAMQSWKCPPEDEQKFRDLAEDQQKKQSLIQKEITRRG